MPQLRDALMQRLYGRDIWLDFEPDPTAEVQGWNGQHYAFLQIEAEPRAKIIVDVGVWKGQSTITSATILRNSGRDGVVIAVDTFLGSPEHWGPEHGYFGRSHGMPDLYRTFLSNVKAAGFDDYVIPMPQTSTTAAAILKAFGIRPDVVHIDAAHEYREVLIDLQDWWDVLAPGGFLLGDDYHESWPGVIRAADEFSASVGAELWLHIPKYILRKPDAEV